MVSLTILLTAKKYSEVHADNQIPRTKSMIEDNLKEKEAKNVKHINGVVSQSPLWKIPHFDPTLMTPQCYSHDTFEGCLKGLLHEYQSNLCTFSDQNLFLENFSF